MHARRTIDFGTLAQLERAHQREPVAHTVDYDPPSSMGRVFESPAFIGTLIVAAASVLVNIILLVMMISG